MTQVIDNCARTRFELEIDGQIVFADYRKEKEKLFVLHVESPPALRGKGAAGALMEGIMQLAKQEGKTVVPICSYAAAWMKRHNTDR